MSARACSCSLARDSTFFLPPNRFTVGGEGRGEGGSCYSPGSEQFRAARDKAVSCTCRRPSSFLFACPRMRRSACEQRSWPGRAEGRMPGVKRKEPKRSGTPMARPPGVLPSGCAGGLRGFPTAPPCADGKLARIPAGHPADFPPPARRATGGPGRAARSCTQKQRQQHPTPALPCMQGRETAGLRGLAFAPASGAHDARLLFRGPLGGGEAGTARPRSGHRQGWRCLFAGAGAPSKSPAPPHGLAGQDAWQAPPRGVLSSWLLLLWTSKGEVTRAAAAARNCSETCVEAEAPLTPTLSPNDGSVGGEGDKAAQDVAPTSKGAQS